MKQFSLVLFFLLATSVCAQTASEPAVQKADTICFRYPDASWLNGVAGDEEYNYSKIEEISLFELFENWFFIKLGNFLKTKTGIFISGYLVYILSLLAIILFVIVFRKFRFRKKIQVRNQLEMPLVYQSDENAYIGDLDNKIAEALKCSDYRRVVRFTFVKALRQLADADLFTWQLNKTNYQYVTDIKDESVRQEFILLTTGYERIWYGETVLSNSDMQELVQAIGNFVARQQRGSA